MNNELRDVLRSFALEGTAVRCEPYGSGHINVTYLAETDAGRRYILQKINHHVFSDVSGLMENISAVTSFLRERTDDPRGALCLIPTSEGDKYLHRADGSFWRVYVFVEGSLCLQQAEQPLDFGRSATAFGTFMQQLAAFPAETLHETIPNFHNTVDRYRIFSETLARDPMGRAASVREEIAFALAREKDSDAIVRRLQSGELPLRVTHNDTKLNNVLLDAETRAPLCVIDLDTVMPGSCLYDFGDSIRFGASTAREDERDLSRVQFDLELYREYVQGYLAACPDLTETERRMLPMGAKLMTLECGVRFLTDYLDGDRYFAVHREGQNLDRCRTQFRLVSEMERLWDKMERIGMEG